MLFDYTLRMTDTQRLRFKSIRQACFRSMPYIILALAAVALVLSGLEVLALIAVVAGSLTFYVYGIYLDFASMDFTTELDDFDLRDVINDLEHM